MADKKKEITNKAKAEARFVSNGAGIKVTPPKKKGR